MDAETITTLHHDGHTLRATTLQQQVDIILVWHIAMHRSYSMDGIKTDRVVQLHLSFYHRVHIQLLRFAGNGGIYFYRHCKTVFWHICPILSHSICHCRHHSQQEQEPSVVFRLVHIHFIFSYFVLRSYGKGRRKCAERTEKWMPRVKV